MNEKRSTLLENICQINAVANVEGKGRDDFDLAMLLQSESLLQPGKVATYSRAVTCVAKNVRETFEAYRALMRQY